MSQRAQKSQNERDIIERLLDHLPDYDPSPPYGNPGGGGEGEIGMPEVFFEPSVQELLRCLDRLQCEPQLEVIRGVRRTDVAGRTVHAHLSAYYHSEWRIVRPARKKRVLRGRIEWVEPAPTTWKRERVVRFDPEGWIIRDFVRRGVDYVVEAFRGTPYLPPQVREWKGSVIAA